MSGLSTLAAFARKQWTAVILLTLLGALAAGFANVLLPVSYQASTRLFIASPNWNDSTAIADPNYGGQVLAYGDEFTQQRMASYTRLATTPMVLQPVLEQLHLGISPEELAAEIDSKAVADTVMVEITVTDESPTRAAEIANAVAQQLSTVIKEMERPSFTVSSPVQPVLLSPARPPTRPISPRVVLNIICGAVAGFLVGLTYAAAAGSRALAAFGAGFNSSERETPLGVLADSAGLGADVRFLRIEVTSLLESAETRSVLITSPRFTNATLETAELLGAALTEVGARTVLVIADFSGSGGDDAIPGLGDALDGRVGVSSVIVVDKEFGFSRIPAGKQPSNPVTGLASAKMGEIIEDLAGTFQYVLVVAPAVLESTDALDLANWSGASMLLCPLPETSDAELRECERLLGNAQGTYLGRVMIAARTVLDRNVFA